MLLGSNNPCKSLWLNIGFHYAECVRVGLHSERPADRGSIRGTANRALGTKAQLVPTLDPVGPHLQRRASRIQKRLHPILDPEPLELIVDTMTNEHPIDEVLW